MDSPRLAVNKDSSPSIGVNAPRSQRTSSIAINSEEERWRSSSSQYPVGIVSGPGPGSGDKRKPSVSNPYFHASQRRVSQFNAPKIGTEVTDVSGSKLKAEEAAPTPSSYRTEPLEERKFTPHIVKRIMDSALEEALEQMEHYEAVKCRALSTSVCEDIKQKVKFLNYERYKLVCVVYFGSVKGQEMRIASRCLWNHNFDNFASASATKGDIFAVAMMYGVYHE